MNTIPLAVACVLTGGASVLCLWLWRRLEAIRKQRDRLAEQHEQLQAHNQQLLIRNEVLQKTHENDEQRLAEFKQQIQTHLKALASDALSQSSQEFLKLAGKVFEAEHQKAGQQLEANKQAVENLVKPVREALAAYQQALLEAEKQRTQAFGSISQQARQLAEEQRRLQQETANLVKALRRPEGRGRWGELQMQRLFELAGMTEHVDFDSQATQDSGDRPDYVIHLPNERTIVIDVKTPLDAYLDATEATDPNHREQALERHARQVRHRVKELASKNYQDQLSGSPEFVVLFIPGEAMLYAAAHRDPDLLEWAMSRNVIIATPTLTLALLKTVAMGWRERALTRNAQQIAEAATELYRRLGPMFGHLGKLYKSLKATNENFNKLVGSLQSSVLPQARRMEDLDSALAGHVPTDLPSLEVNPRRPDAPEARPYLEGEASAPHALPDEQAEPS